MESLWIKVKSWIVDNNLISVILFGIIGLIIIFGSPYFFVKYGSGVSYLETGQIGDTIGGISGPFLNLIGSILLFYTIILQIKSIKIQNNNSREDKIFYYFDKIEEISDQEAMNDANIIVLEIYNYRLNNRNKFPTKNEFYEIVKLQIDRNNFKLQRLMLMDRLISDSDSSFEFYQILRQQYFYKFEKGLSNIEKELEEFSKQERDFTVFEHPIDLMLRRISWCKSRFSKHY